MTKLKLVEASSKPQGPYEASLEGVALKMSDLALGLASAGSPTVDSAIAHHFAAGGGRFRAKLCLSAASALDLRGDDSLALAAACELLHNASLIHDDLQDRDRIRRGREAVWSLFGEDVAICAGDLLISAAYCALAEISIPSRLGVLTRLMHERTAEAIHGQTADLSYRSSKPPSFVVYQEVAAAKSGSLLSLPLELPLQFSGRPDAAILARSAARAFATGYQIADDIKDVAIDSGCDNRDATLNAVLVLRGAGYHNTAEQRARAHAVALFKTAIDQTGLLPHDCGRDLAVAASRLSSELGGGG